MSKNILVIDDDTRIRNLLSKFLDDSGFEVSSAKDATQARELIEEKQFDLLIVDVMMPGENGIEFTQDFRKTSKTPIIILTARGESADRISGLESGADDYLPKPFEPKELLLRINNIFKRIILTSLEKTNKSNDKNIQQFGEFSFNITESRLKKGSEFIHITDSEAKILTILCQNQSKPLSREELSKLCGGIDTRSIDVQITRIRKKIETNPKQPNYLQTVRNCGYILHK
jgi:two-component system phosphate regulon response regulator OmpR